MTQIAFVVLGAAALLVHVLAMLLATPLLVAGSAPRPFRRRFAGGWRSLLLDPFRTLIVLAGKEPVRSDGASIVSVTAPAVSLGLTAAAALLVPSFATGMLDWPLSDLLLVLGLLVGARLVRLAAAADEGASRPGMAAVGAAVDGLLVLPGLALATVMLVLLSGSIVLDTMLAGHGGLSSAGGLACAAALGMAALACGGRDTSLSPLLSGPDLALFRIESGLHRLVWIDLVGALAWPGSLAPAQSGPLHWLLALLLWLLRFVAGAVMLAWLDDHDAGNRGRRRMAGLSLLAALLGPILMLAGQGGG